MGKERVGNREGGRGKEERTGKERWEKGGRVMGKERSEGEERAGEREEKARLGYLSREGPKFPVMPLTTVELHLVPLTTRAAAFNTSTLDANDSSNITVAFIIRDIDKLVFIIHTTHIYTTKYTVIIMFNQSFYSGNYAHGHITHSTQTIYELLI